MGSRDNPGFLKQGLQSLYRRWQAIAGAEYDAEQASLRPSLPPEDLPLVRAQMEACLVGQGGEVLARSRAAALGQAYLALNEEGRERFLRLMAQEFDLEEARVQEALDHLKGASDPAARRRARKALRRATESPRTRILTRFNALPEGVKFLVDLRAELIPLARQDPLLASLDDDLKDLLTSWFDVDFLELRRISWQTASGALLEKFISYEAVHPVESWEDLKNRLDYDRRYFAFFHPRMPQEPLIFLEVALVEGLVGSIQDLLDPAGPQIDPAEADTAVFYSISSAQKGLAGVSFGGFLIKRVVEQLLQEFRGLKTFGTLSPMPGFLPWLLDALGEGLGVLPSGEARRIAEFSGSRNPEEWLHDLLESGYWAEEESLRELLKPTLLGLAARFLLLEKRRDGSARDPVANFHLSNGARVERINWMADTSSRGIGQSAGVMVNYLYDLRRIEENHESYRGTGQVVASSGVKRLQTGR